MDNTKKMLWVDNDITELKWLDRLLSERNWGCIVTNNSSKALELIPLHHPALVLISVPMSHKDMIVFLHKIKIINPQIVIIVVSDGGTIDAAIEAIKEGAYDYIQKPYSVEKLKKSIQRGIDFINNNTSGPSLDEYSFDNIIGQSAIIKKACEKIIKISQSDANVLIYGESGTGKELFARSIHKYSLRHAYSFIPLDCVALPENLLESELFGYEKGAFTGADYARKGLFECADKGTLFLDEICELDINLQSKLLRVLQEREFRRIGGRNLTKVNLRFIAATNRNPFEAVKCGQFREDLFYRLHVIPIKVPSLRERKEDIPLLFDHFLRKFSKIKNAKMKTVEPDAVTALMNYSWGGNVRELMNLAERLDALVEGDIIELIDLPDYIKCTIEPSNIFCPLKSYWDLPFQEAKKKVVEDFEKEYFTNLIQKHSTNLSKQAKLAQISRSTLYRMINIYDLHKFI